MVDELYDEDDHLKIESIHDKLTKEYDCMNVLVEKNSRV